MSAVAHVWRDETDRAVEVLAVVPIGEGLHPSLRVGPRGKALGWPVWAILAGAEHLARHRREVIWLPIVFRTDELAAHCIEVGGSANPGCQRQPIFLTARS